MSIKEEYEKIVKLREEESDKCLPELPDYWEKSPAIKAEIELFSRSLQETVEFLNNECTEEQLLWLSEVFEEISAKLQSWEFVDALNRAAQRFSKHAERFSACISYAEGQLNDEVYRQRYPDFGK